VLEIDQLMILRDQTPLHYDFNVARGEILAIQGRSGVGKSTLLSALAGFVTPQQGDMRWQGESLLPLAPEQRPVSMLFQDHNLFEHLSVEANLKLGFPGAAPVQALHQAAEQLGVATFLNKKPSELSGGQRQRVAIIRTLLRPEPLVLLDEPFAELDPSTRQLAAEWVKQQAKSAGKTLLLITHQQEDVTRLADRNLVLGG